MFGGLDIRGSCVTSWDTAEGRADTGLTDGRGPDSVIDALAMKVMARPLMAVTVGSRRYQEIKHSVAAKVMGRMPETLAYIEDYAEEAMDIRNTLVQKMQELTPEEFEQLIRPAFQQDEWILITVGAVLGFAVGELQVLLVENLAH